jgi:hypothetical protein
VIGGDAEIGPFAPSRPPVCSRCEAHAVFRIGGVDACGRHAAWAIAEQVEEGARQTMTVGRYRRLT